MAKYLIGKILNVRHDGLWLSARIIETEAYYLSDKASHASLGFTNKRKALFMPAGTIYMYYARGGDSLNVSCRGAGNAVLIKSGYPYFEDPCGDSIISLMQKLNPKKNRQPRKISELCSGQTLLCKSLGLQVKTWDQQQFTESDFYIKDVNYAPNCLIQATRLGIRVGRDEDLLYRFVDFDFAKYCTKNPLASKKPHFDYVIHENILG